MFYQEGYKECHEEHKTLSWLIILLLGINEEDNGFASAFAVTVGLGYRGARFVQ